jgi:hypothetical protein
MIVLLAVTAVELTVKVIVGPGTVNVPARALPQLAGEEVEYTPQKFALGIG